MADDSIEATISERLQTVLMYISKRAKHMHANCMEAYNATHHAYTAQVEIDSVAELARIVSEHSKLHVVPTRIDFDLSEDERYDPTIAFLATVVCHDGDNVHVARRVVNVTDKVDLRQTFVRVIQACATCGANNNVTLRKCLGCSAVRYCNRQCQAVDWRQHKRFCKYKNSTTYKSFTQSDGKR